MQNKSFVNNLFHGISGRIRRFFPSASGKPRISWTKEKFLKHAPAGPERSFTYAGHQIYFTSPSEFLYTFREIFEHEIYSISLPPDAFILDCGANIGLSTLYFKQISPQAEITAFEPDQNNYRLLQKNIASFGYERIFARQEAVWIEDTNMQFSGDGTMGSKLERGETNGSITVKASRLKTFINRRVDFLKIDIEGAEYEVLKDIAPQLHLVQAIFLEYHGSFAQVGELTEMFSILQKAGFHYYIKEAANIYESPFRAKERQPRPDYDVQLNIFCAR